ncbi:CHRNA6 [Mytilus edulis]|uniref:CHRNA6 n=1 Tax=Mytilus edulis TaxID=6550 RepID=A0A8S3UNA6_MYTED|nr:CHRNA6 [Mytilus edulis]
MASEISIICLFLTISNGFCQTSDDVKNLLTDLFVTNSYNKQVRPVVDQTDVTDMYVSMELVSIHDIDEVNEKMVFAGFLKVSWIDELLVWDSAAYNDIEFISVLQDNIWKPDFVLKNGFQDFKELGGSFYYILVDSDGWVTWYPYHVFENECSIDVTYYPFDEQTCHIRFALWTYTDNLVVIDAVYPDIDLRGYRENSLWSIISTSVQTESVYDSSEIIFTINLRRKATYYIVSIITPLIFLGILNSLVFIIPADAGEKMSYSVTVFLSFAVFLTLINDKLPVNSENTCILSIYIVCQLGYGVLVLIVTSLQLRIHHREEGHQKSKIFVYVVKFERKIRCSKRNVIFDIQDKERVDVDEICATDETIKWRDVSSAIDLLGFWIFSGTNFIVTVVTFIYMSGF